MNKQMKFIKNFNFLFFFSTIILILAIKVSIFFSIIFLIFIIIAKLEKKYFEKINLKFTLYLYICVCYFIWKYSVLNLNPGNIESSLIVLIFPLVFLIYLSKNMIIKSSLFAVFIISILFMISGEKFWFFFKKKNTNDISISSSAADNSHIECKHVNNIGLGYKRSENCKSHKINYYLNDELLSRFWLNTNNLGDRIVPSSKKDSNKFAFFIGGSRTFGDGVSDDETYPHYLTKIMGLKRK